MTPTKESILSLIEKLFPKSYPKVSKQDLISDNLFSPFRVSLPKEALDDVKKFTKELYLIKESKTYQEKISPKRPIGDWPQTPSLLTCLDFHYSPETGLKLIEINTNASLYLPFVLHRFGEKALDTDEMQSLLSSFKACFADTKDLSILDLDPSKEGLYFEFLLLSEWLNQNDFNSNVIALSEYDKSGRDGIYNRYTDFYFENEKSQSLRKDYEEKNKIFSPNPRGYYLLADKKRLDLLRDCMLQSNQNLAKMIPETLLFSEFESKEDLWKNRKKYFFKPSQSFGSKGAFRGKSVSRKAFENLYDPDFVAQEYCPPGKLTFNHKDEDITMKYDLRFYVFNGEVQNYGARLYQGQATNMKTTHGGLAPVEFE